MGKPVGLKNLYFHCKNNIFISHTSSIYFAGSSTEGLVPSWYMAIAAVAACIVTAIVAIIIVLIVCVCKKNRGKSSMEKANGLNGNSRNEFNNPTYSKN